jgi:predicted Fe-Mo cluster-binding NifX family protein
MKVIVTSTGPGLDDDLDPRFGRCQYFLLVDADSMEILESFDNEGLMAAGGAGIQAGQFVASKGAEAIITGNVGPNAIQTLQAAGVGVYLSPPGTVRQAVEGFKKEALQNVSAPSVDAHHGMGAAGATPVPPSGMGMGMGRGMGRGMGYQTTPGPDPDVARLQTEIDGLRSDLKEMKDLLKKLTQSD